MHRLDDDGALALPDWPEPAFREAPQWNAEQLDIIQQRRAELDRERLNLMLEQLARHEGRRIPDDGN